MHYYDAHTHLNDPILFVDRKTHLENFIKIGGFGLVNVGASHEFNSNGLSISQEAQESFKDFFVKTSLGYHPYEVVAGVLTKDNFSVEISGLKNTYSQNKQHIVAIGECGVDFHYQDSLQTLAAQKELFALHCDLAQELDLPIIIHSRDGFQETLDVLKSYNKLKIYFHCRGYGPEQINILLREFDNLYIGFCGNTTYKKAEELRESITLVPLDKLVLETDAPYLSPQIIRGETNNPANVKYIYEFVSQLLNIEEQFLCSSLENNFNRLYK